MVSSENSADPAPSPAALYARHGGHLRQVAASKLGDAATRSVVDEIMNEVFAKLVQLLNHGQAEQVKDWRAYLTTMTSNMVIARGKALARARDQRQSLETAEVDAQQYRTGVSDADPTADVVVARLVTEPLEQQRAEQVEHALNELDPRSRRIIEGRYHDRMTNSALGAELGISGQRVSQLHDQALRRIYQEVTTRR
jgi:RNA polymerase sigma factor (sigma-70 family)